MQSKLIVRRGSSETAIEQRARVSADPEPLSHVRQADEVSTGAEPNPSAATPAWPCRVCGKNAAPSGALCVGCEISRRERQRRRRAPRSEPRSVREARHYELRLAQMGTRTFTIDAFCNHAQFAFDKALIAPKLAIDERVERVPRPGLTTYRRRAS